MDLQLKDRIVFIAGSSRGIGYAIARACLEEGARVALTARGEADLAAAHGSFADEFGKEAVWSRAGDACDTAFLESAVDSIESKFGPIHGAVANVGLYPAPPGYELDDATWAAGNAQNLDSSFRFARAVLRRMHPRKEGALLFISSIAGSGAIGTSLIYGPAKAAINHLARELGRSLGPDGIRVNALSPGNILFPGGAWEKILQGENGMERRRKIERNVPMRRFGRPDEIASVATFLLSPRASFMTGSIVTADGGQMA
ncbi:MAG: SDR family oxidoreductase [Xanthobacteraceae bacterium]